MTFIRTKKIKGQEYAYLTENSWKKRDKKVKQKSKKYLGKIYRFDRQSIIDFFEYHNIISVEDYLRQKDKEEMLNDLIKIELLNHGFKEEREKLIREECEYHKKKVLNSKGNNCAIVMNEGFLTNYTIKKILQFEPIVEEDGYEMAKLLVEAGLVVPKEIFIGFFKKLFKQKEVFE